jgi:hypothetical protein
MMVFLFLLGLVIFVIGILVLYDSRGHDASKFLGTFLLLVSLVCFIGMGYGIGRKVAEGRVVEQDKLSFGNYRVSVVVGGLSGVILTRDDSEREELFVRLNIPVCQGELYVIQKDSIWLHPKSEVPDSACK